MRRLSRFPIAALCLIMRQGNMPMALLRLRMTKQKLTREMDVNWKFYGELPDK